MAEFWWSFEVHDSAVHDSTPDESAAATGRGREGRWLSADRWRESYGAALIESAISHGAQDWNWHRTDWGIVFEVAFSDPDVWPTFRGLPIVIAALDAVPDPVNGFMVYPGRGGSSGARVPRRPRPVIGAGAASIPSSPDPVYAMPQHVSRPGDLRLVVA